MVKKVLFFIVLAICFVSCSLNEKEYKNEVCIIDNTIFKGKEPNCKEGQILSYQPNEWGNKQIPILVTSYLCDFSFPIVYNESGVSCVYKRRFVAKNEEKKVEQKIKEENKAKN